MGRLLLLAFGVGLLLACSDQAPAVDAAVEGSGLAYGVACQADGQCGSGLCVDRFCSKTCQRLADCPAVENVPYDCGEIAEKSTIACYPRRAPTVPYTVGHDCSLDLKCAVGFRCMGPENTASRYCSKTCQSDRDCPPRFRCAQARTGMQPPEPDKWCRRRDFCHPCVIDDQCGGTADTPCVRDATGHGYCSKSCDRASTSCPSWTRCDDAGGGLYQCRPKTGSCFKTEADLCENCPTFGWVSQSNGDFTINEVGTCRAGGACYLLSKTGTEAVCITPCTSDGRCPPAAGSVAFSCFELKSLAGKFCLPSPDGKLFGTCSP